jgi:hypothetical protein
MSKTMFAEWQDAMSEIGRLRAEVARLRSFISTLDCRFTAGDMADIGGMHCPLGVPCARCKANITIEQLANAGIRLDEKAETWREKYLDQRDQIIERCAEVCDSMRGAGSFECAAAIRAMKNDPVA